MKKIALTLTVFLGFSVASFACDAAREGIYAEVEEFGPFDSWDELLEAWEEWVEISC